MLRITGSLFICAACIMYGFYSADRLKRRRDFFNAFVSSLSVLETEIAFGRYKLASVFERIGDTKALCGLYKKAAVNISGAGIKKAWETAARDAAEDAGLYKDEIDIVCGLGAELGMTDIEGQIKIIRRTAELSAGFSAAAAEQYARLARSYRGCGILAGIFFVIVLI